MARGGARQNPRLLARVAELYEAGWSTAEIGEEVGAHRSTVIRWLDRAGVTLRPYFYPEVQDSYIAQRINAGATFTDVGRETGMCCEAVRKRYARWLADQAELDQLIDQGIEPAEESTYH